MPNNQEKLSTLQEVAQRFKVSEKTVRRWFHAHQVEAILLGRRLRFEEREIKRFLDLRRRGRGRGQGSDKQVS